MNDIELLKLAVKSAARKILTDAGKEWLVPVSQLWLTNAMGKPAFNTVVYGLTNAEGNIDSKGLTKALEETLSSLGGKLKGKILGSTIAFVPSDIQTITTEFDKLKATNPTTVE